jgi:hypothetical protein
MLFNRFMKQFTLLVSKMFSRNMTGTTADEIDQADSSRLVILRLTAK